MIDASLTQREINFTCYSAGAGWHFEYNDILLQLLFFNAECTNQSESVLFNINVLGRREEVT